MTEQMHAQEEEMRQNMEELQATQEEMGRNQRAMELREARIATVLNSTMASYMSINEEGYVDFSNTSANRTFGYGAEEFANLHASKLFHEVNAIDMVSFLRDHAGQDFTYSLRDRHGHEFEAGVHVRVCDVQDTQIFVVRVAAMAQSEEPPGGG